MRNSPRAEEGGNMRMIFNIYFLRTKETFFTRDRVWVERFTTAVDAGQGGGHVGVSVGVYLATVPY